LIFCHFLRSIQQHIRKKHFNLLRSREKIVSVLRLQNSALWQKNTKSLYKLRTAVATK